MGANINAQSSSGNTALMLAACYNYRHTVHALLKNNVNLELRNNLGNTGEPLSSIFKAIYITLSNMNSFY